MKDKLRIAIIGCGRFSGFFVPLFKAHPAVEKVWVCDLIRSRAETFAGRFDVEIMESFEKALASEEVNAVAIFTQRFKHGKMVTAALRAGKHVYSAVPCTIDEEDIYEIAELVSKTRLTYSMGETGFYRAATLYCRREMERGTFGNFAFAEAQYSHDIRNMEDSFRSSGGEEWRKYAGFPPLFYPTHSTSMILSAMPGVYAKEVVGMGFENSPRTDIFGIDGQNLYQNPFSNTTMLMKLSNGGIGCVSENRCIGWHDPATYLSRFFGSEGAYEFSVARHTLSTWNPEKPGTTIVRDVSQELLPEKIYRMVEEDYAKAIQEIAGAAATFGEVSPIQPVERLPKELHGLRNGHNGTHHFIVDDFCRAYETGKLSPTNIWQAARYSFPGLTAHKSALAGSKPMAVPDIGEPPADWEVLPYLTKE